MDNVLNLLKCRPCTVCEKYIDGGCTAWECPFDGAVVHEKQNEGHYEYGVFDGEGDLVGNVWRSKEMAEITCRERKAGNPGRDYCVRKRLVMCWEPVEEE